MEPLTYRTGDPEARLLFVMSDTTERRIAQRCFRGRDLRRAVNFCRWEAPGDLFGDAEFLDKFAFECGVAIDRLDGKASWESVYVEVAYSGWVGWSWTDRLEKYADGAALEPYALNAHCTALRIRPSCAAVTAPGTKIITLAVHLNVRVPETVVTVQTIYPGPSVGSLRPDARTGENDVTKRSRSVFFMGTHEGERPVGG